MKLSRLIDEAVGGPRKAVPRRSERAPRAAPRSRRRAAARQAGGHHLADRGYRVKTLLRRGQRPATPARSIPWRRACCRSRSAKRPSSRTRCSTPTKATSHGSPGPDDHHRRSRRRSDGAVSRVEVDLSRIEAVLARFSGEIVQTPPMYSALKHAGKPLYEYAREGRKSSARPRRVTIESRSRSKDYAGGELRIAVACSKGTYIRVLAEDIGRALGCGACLAALRRTRVGRFDVAEAIAAGRAGRAERRGARNASAARRCAAVGAAHGRARSDRRNSGSCSGQAVDCARRRRRAAAPLRAGDALFWGAEARARRALRASPPGCDQAR